MKNLLLEFDMLSRKISTIQTISSIMTRVLFCFSLFFYAISTNDRAYIEEQCPQEEMGQYSRMLKLNI
jgi:hypothetical protein